jgi:thymidylate kinase
MKSSNNLIAICGVDGSGKSTIAHLLMGLLRRCGSAKSEVVWFRWRALTLYALYLYSRLRGLYVRIYVPWLRRWISIHVFYIDAVAKRLYPYLLFIDLTVFYLLHRLSWWIKGIRIVVFDRFYLDALIDVVYTCRYVDKVFLRLFLVMQMRASKATVLDVDVDTAVARKRDIISRSEIEFKRKVYMILAKHLNIPIINAQRDLSYVLNNVCEALGLNC